MSVQATQITGQCLCGVVRYKITASPLASRTCWCRVCQFIGAGSATGNVWCPSDALVSEGELREFTSTADSGSRMHRRFCPACGTHMFSDAESRPHLTFVRAGTLSNRELAAPTLTIWTAQAPSWACISEDLPQLEGQAPPAG